jgi:hypothetical protein
MKYILAILACTQAILLTAQEIPEKAITTKVDKVTVFFESAQVTRNASVAVRPGKSLLKFTELSPFINPKSLQVKVDGNVTVLSVNHRQNYMDSIAKPQELVQLENRYREIEEKIALEEAYISIIDEEIIFLQENRDIGGRNQEVSVVNLREASDFYSTRLTGLKIKRIERTKTAGHLREELQRIASQMNLLTATKEFPSGEVLVAIDAKTGTTIQAELSYLVGNAGWFPGYDIRARKVGEPLEIVYKANVHQNTRVDWENVKLTFSSGNPNLSGIAPELIPYYLSYNSVPPSYSSKINEVSGIVSDQNGNPLPGANVIVKGTSIGTVTDMGGQYSISIPAGATSLIFSYVGYNSQEAPIQNAVTNVFLQENAVALNEVVVRGMGSMKRSQNLSSVSRADEEADEIMFYMASSLPIPTRQVQNQTSVEFAVEIPYSVKSDSRNYLVDMTSYQVPASYEYYCVPKIDRDAFLMAYVTGWEQYNFLEGEANIYFEDTYTGKTILDVRFLTDTLTLSLGRDKGVVVNREKITDLTDRKSIGPNKEDTRAWKISVRNTKSEPVDIALYDQVPIPTLEEIELDVKDVSGGKRDMETGEIRWNIRLAPNQVKEVQLKYTLKYPKNRTIVID